MSLKIPAIAQYAEIFGDREINGRRINIEQLIAELSEEFGPEIARVLNARREWLELRVPVNEKCAFPRWDDEFRDAEGNTRTFREIVQGLIDNFLGRDTPLRWRLNENIPVPEDAHPIKNPGLELTGPWYPLSKAIHQLNADVAVAFEDEEDASPAWHVPLGSPNQTPSVFEGRRNVKRILAGEVPEPYYERGKVYRIQKPRENWPTVFHRIPGIHLLDFHITLNGKPVPAIIVSSVIYILNNYESLKQAGSGVYFYVPKVQTPEEALIIEKLLRRLEDLLGLGRGSIKIAMLYEEANAGRFLPIILWIWRERLIKSSVGRWDYLGSLIEIWKDEAVLPDPQTITMTSPNMMVYQRYNTLMMLMAGMSEQGLNAAPVGGMAAVMMYPQTDPYGRFKYNLKALRDIKLDKLRERLIGLIFVPEEPIPLNSKITLEDILAGRIKGKLYDTLRQSWVATKEEDYVAAGTEPLRADLKELQAIIDAEVEMVMVDGKHLATVRSGLTPEEKQRLQALGLLNEDGKITPWVIPKNKIDTPEKLFSKELWGEDLWHALYDIPRGDITIEHIQHAFYMAANHGFQILNGNLPAAIDDYELNQRLMNDLATYRIFVSWLWTLLHHQAVITKDGYIKKPALTENGVIPYVNDVQVRAGMRFTLDLFEKVWKAHQEWTRAFYAEQDRRAATRLLDQFAIPATKRDEVLSQVEEVLSQAYSSGPFRELSLEDAAIRIAELVGRNPEDVVEVIRREAPRFDRSFAPIIMEVLWRQLSSPRYIQHSARVLFIVSEASDELRSQIMEAIFSPSREEVVRKIQEGKLDPSVLPIHDYIYDYR